MGGWKSKIVLLLIVYFAGFASAIYCLVPVPQGSCGTAETNTFERSVLKSDEFAKAFNVKLHKCIDFSIKTADEAAGLVKQKIEERKNSS